MQSGRLYLSFWHVGLENLPEGRFVHRRVPPGEAKRLIVEARHTGTLECASHDDLFAPYNEHERESHQALCRVLQDGLDIAVSFEDFVMKDEVDGEACESIRPLALVEVDGEDRLLVVNCDYVMADKRDKARLRFDVAPESVTFHLFEAIAARDA